MLLVPAAACDDGDTATTLCPTEVRTTVTLEAGGEVAATCDPDRPLTLVREEVVLRHSKFPNPDRTLALHLPFRGLIGEGEITWAADLHLPHDLAHGTWTVGGEGGPFLDIAEGTPLLTGQLTFSRSRDIPGFDRELAEGGYTTFLTVELVGLKWLQGGTQCGEAEVVVDDLRLRVEETGRIEACP